MINRAFKFIIVSIFLLLGVNLYAIEIYIDDFQVIRLNPTEDEKVIEEENEEISALLKNKILQTSTISLTYIPISNISNKPDDLNILPIKNTLGALAACFFYKIDYILFGEISIETYNNKYLTIIKLYSKEENRIIYDLSYTENVNDQNEYFLGLVNTINQELTVILKQERLEQEKLEQEKLEQERLEQARLEQEWLEQERLEQAKIEEEINNEPEEDENEENNAENEDKNSIIGFFTSIGHYFILNSEWKESISSVTCLELGIKFDFEVADNEKFDFLLRPGFLFDYSFAFNKERDGQIIHYHSLTSRLLLEAAFEFSDKFDFFIGSGIQYRFDIIDYQSPTNSFVTDIPYALGTFASLGFDLLIGKRKNTYIGLTNILDFTFFNELDINLKVMVHLYFKF